MPSPSRPLPTRDSLRRNFAWLSVANAVAKPAWFLFITAACMRGLGAAGYGELTVSMALAGIAVSLAEFGTGDFATREVARRPADASRFFVNLLAGRAALAVLSFAAVVAVGEAIGSASTATGLILAAGAYVLGLKLAEFCRGLYRAFEVLRYEAVSLVVERAIVIATGLVGLILTRTAAGTLAGMAAGMALSLVLNLSWVHYRLAPFRPDLFDLGFARRAYVASAPIGMFYMFTMVLLGGGPIAVELFHGKVAAGEFGAASRLVEMLMLLPGVVCAATLPRLSGQFHRGQRADFARLIGRSALALGAATVGAAIVLTAGAPQLMALLAPGAEFAGSVPLLQAVSWAAPPMALEMLLCFGLIAADEQVFLAVATGLGATFHVLLLASAVPALGGYAAALGLVASHLLIVGLAAARLRRALAPAVTAPAAPPTDLGHMPL